MYTVVMQIQHKPSSHAVWIPNGVFKFVGKACISSDEIRMEIGIMSGGGGGKENKNLSATFFAVFF
jgi:hypothetical protein